MSGVRFKDRITLVTGGTSGVGQAISRAFVSEGSVVVAMDNPDSEQNFTEVSASEPGKLVGVRVKLTDARDVKNAVDHIIQDWGRIDILINNYRLPTTAPFLDTKETDWYQDLEHNLVVAIRFCAAVLPQMIKQKSGVVVNVGSIAGRQPRPVSIVYSTAMAGIISLTRSLAVAMAPHNIRVNGLCTGPTDDPIHQKFVRTADPSFIEQLKRNITLGRYGKTEEVAAAALFLASDESSYIVGQNISVDGGNAMP